MKMKKFTILATTANGATIIEHTNKTNAVDEWVKTAQTNARALARLEVYEFNGVAYDKIIDDVTRRIGF